MSRITFKKQTDRISPYIIISSDDDNVRSNLAAVYRESLATGLDVKLVETTLDEALMVKQMKFGIGSDLDITGVTSDYTNAALFQPGRSYVYLFVNNTTANVAQLSGGTTAGGTDLFAGEAIAANGVTLIVLDYSPTVITPLYLHHAGDGDTWNGASLNLKTISI